MNALRPKPKKLQNSVIVLAAVLSAGLATTSVWSQTTQNNPLIRPDTSYREPQAPSLPQVPPQNRVEPSGPVQAKSLQEEVSANIQKLNADRVPTPLRILLATVYVTAIQGKTAMLRQPVPPVQQAMLANTGGGLNPFGVGGAAAVGLPGAVGAAALPAGLPGTGAGFGALPGALPGSFPGALPGALPGAPLSSPGIAGVGLGQPLPRPTSIRVRDGQTLSLQGYDLTARVQGQEVTLSWTSSENKETVVFQSQIESPSTPAYLPPAAILERPDNAYVQRVQAPAASSGSGSAAVSGATAPGTGAR